MRINLLCTDRGSKVQLLQDGTREIQYYANFGSLTKPDETQGTLQLISSQELHYKPNNRYTIDVNEYSGIHLLPSGKS